MAVKHIKLFNGESIVADVVNEDELTYSCIMPMMTSISNTPEGNVYIAFLRWLPFVDMEEVIKVKKSVTIIGVDVNKTIEGLFRSAVEKIKNREDDEEDEVFEEEPEVIQSQSAEELAFDAALAKKGMVITSKLKN